MLSLNTWIVCAVSLECYNSCDGILLSIVISNAGTGFNSNLLIQSLDFVFSDVFKISDMNRSIELSSWTDCASYFPIFASAKKGIGLKHSSRMELAN